MSSELRGMNLEGVGYSPAGSGPTGGFGMSPQGGAFMSGAMGLMGMFGGPIGIMGAVLGMAIGYRQASAQARAIARTAEISITRINTEMLNARVNEIYQVQELSRAAQVELGAVQNVTPQEAGHVEAIASSLTKVFSGRENLREGLDQFLEASRAQKSDIEESAEEGMPSPALGALSGGLAGLQMGMSVASSMDEFKSSQAMAPLLQGLLGAQTGRANAEIGAARSATAESGARIDLLRARLRRSTAMHENYNTLDRTLNLSRFNRMMNSSTPGGFDLGQLMAEAFRR